MMIRTLGAALLAVAAVAGATAVPAAADPAPVVTLRASATGPVSGAATETAAAVTVTADVTGAPAADAVLTVALPGTADPAKVTVDGAAAPTGTVTATAAAGRTMLTIRMGSGADATTGGLLALGSHPVAVATDLADLDPTAIAPADASFSGTGVAAATTSTTIPLPDLVLSPPPGLDEDGELSLAPGSVGLYVVELSARSGVVRAGELTVAVTSGLRLDSDAGVLLVPSSALSRRRVRELTCTGDATIRRCPLPAVDQPVFVVVPVEATGTAPVGTTGSVTVSALAANGLDATPANNAASGKVRFVAASRLRVTLRAGRSAVPVGESSRVMVTVANEGAGPAADVAAIVLSINHRLGRKAKAAFAVTGFTGRPLSLPGLDGLATTGRVVVATRVARTGRTGAVVSAAERYYTSRRAAGAPLLALQAWDVGSIAPGASRRAVLTLEARHVGRATVSAFAISMSSLGKCLDEDCPNTDSLTLRAIAAPAPHSGRADPIAATGARTEQWLAVALALLLVGTALQMSGRRRRPARRR